MSREIGGVHVCLQVVFSNETTRRKMEAAIETIADAVADNPWLGLDDTVEQLITSFEELQTIPD